MAVATHKFTFEEYLTYEDGLGTRFELADGVLVEMSLGTGKHGAIAKFLERGFDDEIGRSGQGLTAQKFSVGVRSPRGNRWDTSRIPDVTVIPLAQWEGLQNREAVIDLGEPPPLMVVEIVSESTQATDYRTKRAEYSVLDIPEYWIVDPLEDKVTVCYLVDGLYDSMEFRGEVLIQSLVFPNLRLTAAQVLAG
jgi:Uma2 family endonuclease